MLSSKEKQLIMHLRRDARVNINDIALKNKYPKSTLYDLLHKMEESHLVVHKSKIAFDKIGYPVRIMGTVKTVPGNREKLKEYLMQKSHINTLYQINSGHDFHFDSLFRNHKDAQQFLEEMQDAHMIVDMNVHTVIETIHEDRFLTEDKHFQ